LKRKYVYGVIALLAILAVTYPVTWSVYAGTLNSPNHFVCPPLIPCDNSPLSSGSCSGFCVVTIQNALFTPGNLTITAGTTVEWVNLDPQPHTSTCYGSPDCWSSPFIPAGGSYNFTFTGMPLGVYYYQCTIHNQMQGEINIVA
jgi:plastocyanin